MDQLSASEFQAEIAQLIDNLELLVLTLEKKPGDKNTLLAAIRGWHELKSLAGLFESLPIAALAFRIGEVMGQILAGRRVLGEEESNWFLDAIDEIKNFVSALALGQPPGDTLARIDEELSAYFGLTPTPTAGGEGLAAPASPPARGDILIIEDESINRTLLEAMIKEQSPLLTITAVDSAAEGLYYYFTRRFDLVFLDIMMPLVDGNHFINIIEKNHQAGHLPFVSNIVIQTAIQSLAQLTALAKRESVQEIIRKPITPRRIGECIRRYCHPA